MDEHDGAARKRVASKSGLDRRGLIAGAMGLGLAGAGASVLSACSPKTESAGGGSSLKVSSYGGSFETAMSEHLYPVFEKASGIKVESIPQPAGLQFLLQLIEANRAGVAPMDLCISTAVDINRGRAVDLWRTREAKAIPNLGNLPPQYISTGPKGIDGIGALGWFMIFVTNPAKIKTAPTSWAELWNPVHKNAWGLNGGGGSSLMLEIAAATYFGGVDTLNTEAGIQKVIDKIAELKPNTKIWWDSEGTMQTALENSEIDGGVYFADVAATLKANGTPLQVTFPKEGGIIDFGCWCQPVASKKIAEADAFINWMLSPEAQDLIARKVNAPPLIRSELLGLSPEELTRVSSNIPPITVNIKARADHLDFITTRFQEMLSS